MLVSSSSIAGLVKGILPCLAVLLLFSAEAAEASIMRPEMPEFKFEEIASDLGTSAPADPSPESPAEPSLAEFVIHHALGSSGGSSSSSSSSPSPTSSSNSTLAINSLTVSSLADLSLTGWVCGEQRFSLPIPPGNDLLKPPQMG
ncbi:hypothetical protein [Bythopirellula goksoeyrii]|uniref:Uncharacterized protein n=1 Tax=Bythopirellula goksoeyrii TaxID=1400387 RepID=A0A5B9QAC4_9BACT|nr:hypothetical protein [Bythopirellula goksoeyrii]QEG36014.1 hypothetical protein Pr1d_33230 [Bythopirellula goksoeyrii]